MKTYRAFVLAVLCGMINLAAAKDYQPPRLPDGKPDLQGVWTNVSLTTLIRSSQFKSNVLSAADTDKFEQQRATAAARSSAPTDPKAPAPPAGADVGGYNSFWADSGDRLAVVKGQVRTTWLVDPDTGTLPYSAKGRQIFDQKQAFTRQTFDGPEARPMPERCIVGFGSTGGPPMINVLYNNHYQIVQTPDTITILVEMNHDARIIRMNGKHLPANMHRWLGDSVGHWEGDTLVVETKHFHPGESLRLNFAQSFYISPNARVIERFKRVADKQIAYEFSVEDPEIYTQTWRAEMVMNAVDEKIYEYACHEGNYALPGILAGARKAENDR